MRTGPFREQWAAPQAGSPEEAVPAVPGRVHPRARALCRMSHGCISEGAKPKGMVRSEEEWTSRAL
jgi:hypothetical protein